MQAIDGCGGLHVVHPGEREVTLVVLADDVGTLDRLAAEVGSPWMAATIAPLLAGTPERRIGPTPASGAQATWSPGRVRPAPRRGRRWPAQPAQPTGTFQPRPSAISLHVGQTG